MTHYKAVRPDGTSFHDPGFRWLPESGRPIEGHVVTHLTASTVGGDAAHYLSVSVSPTDCTGMSWPCRLLEVEPVGEVVTPSPEDLPNKRAAVAVRIVRELPATDALGPQGVQVAALIERAASLTPDDVQGPSAAWDAARDADWDAAWEAAWESAWDDARDAAGVAARYAAKYAAKESAWDAARDAVLSAAWDVAQAAALALLTRDLITREDYDTLTRAWRTAIGSIHPDDEELSR